MTSPHTLIEGTSNRAKALREFYPLDDVGPMTRDQREKIHRICNDAADLARDNIAMRDALQEFVDRVDAGEIRSKRTYAKFRAALKGSRNDG